MDQLEKRKEPRLPFQLPLEMLRDKQHSPRRVACTTKNISLNGFKALSMSKLIQGEKIVCTFNIPETREKVESNGVVRWCSSNGEHYVGVELSEKQTAAQPLLKLSEAYFHQKKRPAESKKIPTRTNPLSQNTLHSEIYWGMLLKAFNKPLQTDLIGLSTEIELRKFYLKKIQDEVENLSLNEDSRHHLHGIRQTLDKSGHHLDNIISLFQQILTEQGHEKQKEFPEAIHLETLLEKAIKNFKTKLAAVLPDDAARITFESREIPLIFGYPNSIERGLDFLLLYCYHFILFFGARKIEISLDATDNQIFLVFTNDGSKIFTPTRIEMKSDVENIFHEDIKPLERKHLTILSYALDLFTPIKIHMALSNQSGNNQLTITIPL